MAYDPDAASSKRVLAELGKVKVRSSLLRIAGWSTGSPSLAEDLVQDALVEALDDNRSPWVHPKWTFLTHMTFVIRHIWDQKTRKVAWQREVLDGNVARDPSTVSHEPSPDEEVHRQRMLEVYRELGRRLLADLGDKHPVARQVFEAASDGIDEAAEQAAAIGCSIDEVYRARELLKERGQRIYYEWQLSEERRMRAQRATVKDPSGPRVSGDEP